MKTLASGEFELSNKPALTRINGTLYIIIFTALFFCKFSLRAENSNPGLFYNLSSFKKQDVNAPYTTESLRSNLYLLNADNSTVLADGVLTEYNNLYHDSVTLEDAYKFTNIKENIGLLRYGKTLAVERRPIIGAFDTLFFKLWKTVQRNYQIEFIAINLNHPGMLAFVVDSYLGTNTPLNLEGTTRINFAIDSNIGSSDVNRFKIIYHTISSAPLPVNFTSFKAYRLNEKISLDWKVENEISIEKYEVEKSINGSSFYKITSIPVADNNRVTGKYSWTDAHVENVNNFYRIKSIDLRGLVKYSAVTKAMNAKAVGPITIFPNPITNNIINLQFTNQVKGIYYFKLTSNTGQVMYSGSLNINSTYISHPLFIKTPLKGGIYQLQIKKPDNTWDVQKAIVQPY